MKLKTLMLLVVAVMLLTSVSVWSLTKPLPEAALAVDSATKAAGATGRSKSKSTDSPSQFLNGGAIKLEGRLGHPHLLANQTQVSYLLFNLTAARNIQGVRSPLNLAIVIDRSGSMEGKRMSNAKAAAKGMISRLADGDTVTLVAYDREAEMIVPPTSLDDAARSRIREVVDGISAQGGTCISCGLELAFSALTQRTDRVHRILLLSDGEANQGLQTVADFEDMARRGRERGVAISTVGVDVEYNQRVMAVLASASNGRHHFVENPDGLARVFDDELSSLVSTLASDAELVVELPRGVRTRQVFDRDARVQSNRVSVPFGTLSAGEQKTLLIEVELDPQASGPKTVADARFSFTDLVTRSQKSCGGSLGVQLVRSQGDVSELDPVVAVRLFRSETAEALTQANELVKDGKPAEARDKVREKLKELRTARKPVARRAGRRRTALSRDLDRQESALESAIQGFAEPPPGTASDPRKGDVQIRRNQESASVFGI